MISLPPALSGMAGGLIVGYLAARALDLARATLSNAWSMRPPIASIALVALTVAAPALAQPTPTGLYRAQAGPDVASMLELAGDGRFRYQRSEGALDEQASGRWTQTPEGATLETLPHPRPPEWQINTIAEAKDSPLTVMVRVPGGGPDGLAGIYLRIGFANGDRQAGMTQYDGWQMDPDETRQPIWIEFSEPIHGVTSQRFDLPKQGRMALTVTLVPNDIGIAAFEKTPVTVTKDGIVLHWRGQDIPYARAKNRVEGGKGGISIRVGPSGQ
ncbi:MAG TPA: hypothetical protein VGE65_01130 [Sphingobium sp.]